VLRRLAAWLILCVGVVAFGSPVLACGALAAPTEDCCPQGAPSPCSRGEPAGGVACCAVAPITFQSAALEAHRTSPEQPLEPGSPDPLILATGLAALATVPTASILALAAEPEPGRDATLTYLRTGRLRL
jgi:hypothetical protein